MSIHKNSNISKMADIEYSNRGSILSIGEGVWIDSFVKIKFAGGAGDILIGDNCFINSGSVIYSGNGVSIASNVLIAANCTLAATNHSFAEREVPIRLQGFQNSRGGIVVEEDVWIGANTVILDGARIERGSVVAAGSVVRQRLAAYSVYAGNPAKKIGVR